MNACFRCLPGVLLTFLLTVNSLAAQAPNGQPPTLQAPFPVGMQRGTSLDLVLTGANLQDPLALWTSFPAQVTFPTDKNNGKEPGRLLVRLQVPTDAPVGTHALRLLTSHGISNLRIFCIDDLHQVLKEAKHTTAKTAQEVGVPAVICGQIVADTSDWYRIKVQAGQRLSFDLLGRRLGSVLDAQITLRDAKSGRELPGGYSNDAPGLQTDPRLTYTFKEAGDVLIELHDVTFRGADDFYYRLRIGDFPCVTTPLPMAIKRGTKATVRFAGVGGEQALPVEIQAPTDPAIPALWVTPKGANGLHGWPVPLVLSDLDESLEQEPNNEIAKANRIKVPGAVTARFEQKGDQDYFVFAAKKGQRLLIQADSHEFHSPTEVYVVLRDAKGTQLQASNPMTSPRLDFTPMADGDYVLAVEHLHLWGGPTETYRISVVPHEPGFDVTAGVDRIEMAPGATRTVPVQVVRHEYTGPIEVRVIGAGLSGSVMIPMGQTTGQLPILAADSLAPGPVLFGIEGKATIAGKEVRSQASIRTVLSHGLANLPVPPRPWYHQLAMGVTERVPFTLTAKLEMPTATPGKPATLTVTATRIPGFIEELAVSVTDLPAHVTATSLTIPAGQNQGQIKLMVGDKAAVGNIPITLGAKVRYKNRDYAVTTKVALEIKK